MAFIHFLAQLSQSPDAIKRASKNLLSLKSAGYVKKYGQARGVSGRNAALKWLLDKTSSSGTLEMKGVLYFGDDDNTYDLRLFAELAQEIPPGKVGMMPVGLVAPWALSSPVVKGGKVVGFLSNSIRLG